MELQLQRRYRGEGYTVGTLSIDGKYFCDTLEDADRGLTQSTPSEEIRRRKIAHETAIPTGMYNVIVNRSPAKRRMLPRLQNVPGFSGILIHRNNTKSDSSGCILVGGNKVKGKVINSTQYEKRLVEILTQAQERGEEIRITVNCNILHHCDCEVRSRKQSMRVHWIALLRTSQHLVMTITAAPFVIANAVKQSMRVHWIALLRYLATPRNSSDDGGGR
jgi:hypothetical protein